MDERWELELVRGGRWDSGLEAVSGELCLVQEVCGSGPNGIWEICLGEEVELGSREPLLFTCELVGNFPRGILGFDPGKI